MNKNSNPVHNFFLGEGWGDSAPNSKFSKLLELSETSRARKLIFGLHVNIDKGNSRRYDATRSMAEDPAKIRNPLIGVLHILREVKFKFRCLQLK